MLLHSRCSRSLTVQSAAVAQDLLLALALGGTHQQVSLLETGIRRLFSPPSRINITSPSSKASLAFHSDLIHSLLKKNRDDRGQATKLLPRLLPAARRSPDSQTGRRSMNATGEESHADHLVIHPAGASGSLSASRTLGAWVCEEFSTKTAKRPTRSGTLPGHSHGRGRFASSRYHKGNSFASAFAG